MGDININHLKDPMSAEQVFLDEYNIFHMKVKDRATWSINL